MAEKTELVSLGLKPGQGIDQQITLPRGIVAAEGIKRSFVVTGANQQVPQSVRDWMIADPRYNGWFVGELISPSLVGAAAGASSIDGQPFSGAGIVIGASGAGTDAATAQAITGGQTSLTDPNAGNPPPVGETWSESNNVPDLRAYAHTFGVELKSSDNKAEVVAKLREQRGAFEVKDQEPPTA